MNKAVHLFRSDALIIGTSEMAERIRAFDWSGTSLGRLDEWSPVLLTAANLMLHSPFPTILSWGEEMVFLYNDAAISTLSAKHPRALGAGYREVFSEAWELVGTDLEACLHQGKTSVRDNMFIPVLLDGVLQEHYWSYSLIPVYDNGKVEGIYDAFRNMTETVVGARKLRENEARLKLATEVAQLGVFVWDTGLDRGSWENDRMYEIFGQSRELGPVNGEEFLRDFLLGEFRQAFRDAIEDTLQHGSPLHFECPMYSTDGELRTIQVNGNFQPGVDTSDGRILGTIQDVTELRRTEKTLSDSAKRLGELAAIVASSEDVIISKNLDGIITSWNDSATRVFGYTADEMIGTSILRLIPEELQSDEPMIIENIRAGKRIEHFETVRLTKSGERIDVSVTISPVKDAKGQVIGASKILRDVSDRKRIEQSLLQAEKIAATGRMAATIAHEINNPLEAVMNLLFLLRPLISDEEGCEYLATAESELSRVSHIAKQTLGFYREHASASLYSLAEIVNQALPIYEPRCSVAGIVVSRTIDTARKLVIRRGEMMQVVSNLIANAIYAMPKGGSLSISVSNTASPVEGVALTVTDTGSGIAPDVLPKVFDAFFTTRATVGTGIGLFVAKQFVEGHGGQIAIDSCTAPEKPGTTVRVFLPSHTTYASSPAPERGSSNKLGAAGVV